MGTEPIQRASDSTRAQVERICAGTLGERMRASHRHRHRSRCAEDIEDAFQEAATQAIRLCRADHEGAVYTFMWRAMESVLNDEGRYRSHELATPDDANVFDIADARTDPQVAIEEQENERELVGLFELLARKLGARQRAVLALHVRGVERRSLARELDVSERIVKRDLERTLNRARALLVARCGGGCDQGTKLVWRFAFGVASSHEATQAQLHLIACPSCQGFLGRLGWWREAAAAAIPVPAARQLDPHLAERVVHKAADALDQAKRQLADAAGHAKQHATVSYARAAEYTPIASVRPGAAATVVAGCVALSGGGVYCVQNSVNPIHGLAGITESQPKQKQQPKTASTQPPQPVETAPPADAPQAPAQAAPPPPAEPPPAEPPPAAAQPPAAEPPPPAPQPTPAPVEFNEPASAPPPPSVQPQTSSQPSQPAPAPPSGTDFGP